VKYKNAYIEQYSPYNMLIESLYSTCYTTLDTEYKTDISHACNCTALNYNQLKLASYHSDILYFICNIRHISRAYNCTTLTYN